MKSRFCPSPTGLMHLGNTRTALFNALLATGQQGIFLLRIEDTDQARSHEDHTAQLMADLRWLGLDWQEGPEVGGSNAPYFQSERLAVYKQYYDKLIARALAYPCFCSEDQLALNRKIQRSAGLPPRYPGTCVGLSKEAVDAKIAQGERPTLRFKVPKNTVVEFQDFARGVQRFNSDDIGDFIIRRADLTASFMFCNAIDDALMGVTHALRGEDHLTNTPRQVLILQALELTPPTYGHISLILGADGAPLSKRNGSRSVRELHDEGYLPLAIVNYLARLGHFYSDDRFLSFEDLASSFSLTALGTSPARFDADQLNHWQREAVLALTPDALVAWLRPHIADKVPSEVFTEFCQLVRPNILHPTEALPWVNACFSDHLEHTHEHKVLFRETGVAFFEAAIECVQQFNDDFQQWVHALQTQFNLKGKALFMPLRIALTGEAHGPEMVKIVKLMGAARAKLRFEAALYLA